MYILCQRAAQKEKHNVKRRRMRSELHPTIKLIIEVMHVLQLSVAN